MPSLDVYCFGHVTTGVILRLKDRYPEPDGYAEIAENLENHAGEAAGSALVLNRLGARVALEGNWIGDTPACRRTLDFLRKRGIDCSGLVVKPGYAGVNEIVISDGASRTVFGRFGDLLSTTVQWPPPDLEKLRAAKIVCVDPSFGETTLRVARAAKEFGRLLVTSDARHDGELARLADANVVSGELIRRDYPEASTSEDARARLFEAFLEHAPGLVVFTAGSRPAWYAQRGEPRSEMPPFAVEVVDSAGAGDGFRGGLIHGMLRGLPDDAMVQFASAVAALICTRAPGCVHAPTLDEVRTQIARQR